jgi:hypothetical protein
LSDAYKRHEAEKKLVILFTGKVDKLIFIAKANSNPGLDTKILGTG